MRLWNLQSGTCDVTLSGHKGQVTALRYNQQGGLLASGAQDTDIIVWDVAAESGLYRLRGHQDQVTDLVSLTPCNTCLAISWNAAYCLAWKAAHCLSVACDCTEGLLPGEVFTYAINLCPLPLPPLPLLRMQGLLVESGWQLACRASVTDVVC